MRTRLNGDSKLSLGVSGEHVRLFVWPCDGLVTCSGSTVPSWISDVDDEWIGTWGLVRILLSQFIFACCSLVQLSLCKKTATLVLIFLEACNVPFQFAEKLSTLCCSLASLALLQVVSSSFGARFNNCSCFIPLENCSVDGIAIIFFYTGCSILCVHSCLFVPFSLQLWWVLHDWAEELFPWFESTGTVHKHTAK